MKKLSLPLLALLLMLFACKEKKTCTPVDQENEKEAITLVLERYVIGNETKQMELIRRVWAPDPDIMVFGTDRDERLIGWDAIREAIEDQFRNFEDTYIAMTEPLIKVNETCNTAWFSAIMNYNFVMGGKAVHYEGLRFTGVLEKRLGQWYIVQSHISLPADAMIGRMKRGDLGLEPEQRLEELP